MDAAIVEMYHSNEQDGQSEHHQPFPGISAGGFHALLALHADVPDLDRVQWARLDIAFVGIEQVDGKTNPICLPSSRTW